MFAYRQFGGPAAHNIQKYRDIKAFGVSSTASCLDTIMDIFRVFGANFKEIIKFASCQQVGLVILQLVTKDQ